LDLPGFVELESAEGSGGLGELIATGQQGDGAAKQWQRSKEVGRVENKKIQRTTSKAALAKIVNPLSGKRFAFIPKCILIKAFHWSSRLWQRVPTPFHSTGVPSSYGKFGTPSAEDGHLTTPHLMLIDQQTCIVSPFLASR
jgi:hypothetical protein